MIIFLYGEDTYSSSKRLNQLKQKFKEEYGDINISIFDFEDKDLEFSRIAAEIKSMPFLSNKRLVIVKNLLKAGGKDRSKKMNDLTEKVPETTVLIFFEDKESDKRSALYKKLHKVAECQEFKPLRDGQLSNWVKLGVEKRGGRISFNAAQRLALSVGQDLWRLSNEIDKLINFAEGREIKPQDIDLLVQESIQAQIFDLVDALGAKDYKQALSVLNKLLKSGKKEPYILSMIVFGFRNLVLVKKVSKVTSDQREIAKKLSLHPYVVQKTLAAGKNFRKKELRDIYQELLETDIAIKTGKKEPSLALNLLIMEACKHKVTGN